MSAMQVWKFPSPAKLAAARGRIRSAGGSFSSTQREGSIRGRPPAISRRLNVSQRVLRKQSVQVVELPLANVKPECNCMSAHGKAGMPVRQGL